MGRRAKKQAVVTKKKAKLSKRFKCPFCSNDDTVECKMDFKASIGSLNCRVCGAAYQMPIHHLHEPIDVFSEWLDDCEVAANPHAQQAQQQREGGVEGGAAAAEQVDDLLDDDEDDEEDDMPSGSGLAAGRSNNNKKPAASTSKDSSSANKRSIDLGLSSDEEDDE
ncbi:hypothetical protein ACA910_000319 [Epithemia clementina (nom. ined.)]